jgi:hypothetical protein
MSREKLLQILNLYFLHVGADCSLRSSEGWSPEDRRPSRAIPEGAVTVFAGADSEGCAGLKSRGSEGLRQLYAAPEEGARTDAPAQLRRLPAREIAYLEARSRPEFKSSPRLAQ